MKIHEYQGKDILRQFGVPVPRGIAALDRKSTRLNSSHTSVR
jgi:succinyl-CoA synthetase beta subunit